MNAEPLLTLVTRVLAKHRFDVVLIGNSAAALQGSPVTTLDLDFMFRKTPRNLTKLRRIADDLDAVVLTPYYPASQLYRVTRDRDGLQLDFMAKIDGIRSYESLRSRATPMVFGRDTLLVAPQSDTISSKELMEREQDLAAVAVLKRGSMKKKTASPKRRALHAESDRALVEQLRRLLTLPPSKRTNFLRIRTRNGGSSL